MSSASREGSPFVSAFDFIAPARSHARRARAPAPTARSRRHPCFFFSPLPLFQDLNYQVFWKAVPAKSSTDPNFVPDYTRVIGDDFTMSLNQARIRTTLKFVDAQPHERKGMYRDIPEFLETVDLIAIYCRMCAAPPAPPRRAVHTAFCAPARHALRAAGFLPVLLQAGALRTARD